MVITNVSAFISLFVCLLLFCCCFGGIAAVPVDDLLLTGYEVRGNAPGSYRFDSGVK